jgi:7,8-dihydropterin-6-yl-methyl-4-(beta-D-ribofuranosyl)aminobenzene 5'-phosphate synthase
VKGRGLVVITSCGPAGVINSVRHVQKISGVEKVHAIVGGFHLAPAPDEIVARRSAPSRRSIPITSFPPTAPASTR